MYESFLTFSLGFGNLTQNLIVEISRRSSASYKVISRLHLFVLDNRTEDQFHF